MDSEGRHPVKNEWLLVKRLRVKRKGDEHFSILPLALGYPRKLRKKEISPLFPHHSYGCVIQTGQAFTRHIVYGSDAFSALAHAVLSFEKFLSIASKDCELRKLDGKPFDPSTDLVVLGLIGKQYMKMDGIKSD